MDDETFGESLRAITDKLAEWFEGRSLISGSELNALISYSAPSLNVRQVMDRPVGPGALKAFVEAHLADMLEQCGNRGGDIVYREAGSDTVVASSVSAQDIWKCFVSPSTKSHLVFAIDQGVLIAKGTPPRLDRNELGIDHVTLEEHAAIRFEFSSDPGRAENPTIISAEQFSENFPKWIELIRSGDADLYKNWGLFRRARILEIFESRLSRLEIDPVDITNLVTQMGAAQRQQYAERKEANENEREAELKDRTTARAGGGSHLEDARRIAGMAIERLSLEELRGLRLPLGIILDIVN